MYVAYTANVASELVRKSTSVPSRDVLSCLSTRAKIHNLKHRCNVYLYDFLCKWAQIISKHSHTEASSCSAAIIYFLTRMVDESLPWRSLQSAAPPHRLGQPRLQRGRLPTSFAFSSPFNRDSGRTCSKEGSLQALRFPVQFNQDGRRNCIKEGSRVASCFAVYVNRKR